MPSLKKHHEGALYRNPVGPEKSFRARRASRPRLETLEERLNMSSSEVSFAVGAAPVQSVVGPTASVVTKVTQLPGSIPPSQWINAVGYNPTWPYWSSLKPTLTITGVPNSNTIDFTYGPWDMPWTANNFVGDSLFDVTASYFYQNSPIASITGNVNTVPPPGQQASNSLTITTGAFNSSIKGHTFVIATDNLTDSDFFNSAFEALWNTPRVNVDGNLVSDIQAMRMSGFNAIRLYNWDPNRGTTSGAYDQHIPFLNDVYYGNTAGTPSGVTPMKVLVPVSNFFLRDGDIVNGNFVPYWGKNTVPTANDYAYTNAPTSIQNDLQAFIKSVVVNGKLSPAVLGFEIGNEIDLNSGALTGGNNAAITTRSLWWVVNLQRQLQQLGYIDSTDSQGIKFTIPVSNADQAGNPNPDLQKTQTSWFEVFQTGANSGDYTPHGPGWNTKFTAGVLGLQTALGAFWYTTWMFNSYQTFQVGYGLSSLIGSYNHQITVGDWTTRWPGTQFNVPLVLTELGSQRVVNNLPVDENTYFDEVANQQALVAQKFLTGQMLQSNGTYSSIVNKHFQGYTIFEFNDEPNKNNLIGGPDSEQVRGIFKYYLTADRNVDHFRSRHPIPSGAVQKTTTTYVIGSNGGFAFAPLQYTIYQLYPITSNSGESLIDALKAIFKIKS
jgi:hypothetical protein